MAEQQHGAQNAQVRGDCGFKTQPYGSIAHILSCGVCATSWQACKKGWLPAGVPEPLTGQPERRGSTWVQSAKPLSARVKPRPGAALCAATRAALPANTRARCLYSASEACRRPCSAANASYASSPPSAARSSGVALILRKPYHES